jgi:hypothetical protein
MLADYGGRRGDKTFLLAAWVWILEPERHPATPAKFFCVSLKEDMSVFDPRRAAFDVLSYHPSGPAKFLPPLLRRK